MNRTRSSVAASRLWLVLLALMLWAAVPIGAAAESRPRYSLQMSVAFEAGTVDVVQKTTFRNDTGVDLASVVFQVVPAYFDAFALESAQVNGTEVAASGDGSVLELALGSPLAAGANAEVDLRYQLQVPLLGGRFGRGNGIMALGNFFPALAVYRDGWDRHQYVDTGDAFFTEIADFDVKVTSDVPVTVAATAAGATQDGWTAFSAEGVRDFGMTVSDRYRVRTRDVDGIQVSAYGPSDARLDPYLDAAERSLRWYAARFGAYPYPTLGIAEIHADDIAPTAMEYPALIMVYGALGADGGGVGSYSDYVIAHEVGHQWFYSQVGNDEVSDPWLDEALTTYTDLLFLREEAPASFAGFWQRNADAYRARVTAGGDRPVNTTVYDYPNDAPYFDIVYRKGAIFLDKLRTSMGDAAFFALLRDYVRTYTGKVATPRAFLDMAYTRVGEELPPLASGYFTYGAFADGKGYRLDVRWPEQLSPEKPAAIEYSAGFQASEIAVWLDNRALYRGPGGRAEFSLQGVQEGEYVLRLDLVDARGALYQRATRVSVK